MDVRRSSSELLGSHRFAGRTVLVTGAGSGIGWEMARRFAEEGATVLAADVDAARVPPDTHPIRADVSRAEEVEAMIASALTISGRLDVLCNNAGVGSTRDVIDCTLDEWERVLSTNVTGVFLGMKYALPHMLAQSNGCVINTASIAGLVGLPDRAAYCASKGAVVALTKQVAVQWADAGIRCNCICPGTVDSPWVERLMAATDDPIAERERLSARQPMGRLATPGEIAEAALFLASDAAAFITGSNFVIDGGLTAA